MAFWSYPTRFKLNPTVTAQKVARVSELGRPVCHQSAQNYETWIWQGGVAAKCCVRRNLLMNPHVFSGERKGKSSQENLLFATSSEKLLRRQGFECVCMVKFCNAVFVFYWNLCCSDTYVVVLAGFFSYTILWIEETFRQVQNEKHWLFSLLSPMLFFWNIRGIHIISERTTTWETKQA